jgi:hypothetical protein
VTGIACAIGMGWRALRQQQGGTAPQAGPSRPRAAGDPGDQMDALAAARGLGVGLGAGQPPNMCFRILLARLGIFYQHGKARTEAIYLTGHELTNINKTG